MIIESLVSTLRNIPLPSLPTNWRGREVKILAIGALSLSLIAFLIKKVFWKPAKETSGQAAIAPTTPPKAPRQALSASMYDDSRTPGRLGFNETFARTPGPGSTPNCFGRKIVCNASSTLDDRDAVVIDWTSFEFEMTAIPKDLSLDNLFSKGSKFYVGQSEVDPHELLTTLTQEGWSQQDSIPINLFLADLDTIGKESIVALYSSNYVDGSLLGHKPMHCSITKEDETIVVTLNNLFYSCGDLIHQLYLSAAKKGDKWEIDVFCTTWAKEPTHPLKLTHSFQGWVPFVGASIRQRGLDRHPFIKTHISVHLSSLDLDSKRPTTIVPNRQPRAGALAPIFTKEDLSAVGGDLLDIDLFNCSDLLTSFISRTVVEGASLEIKQKDLPPPRIFKHNGQVFAHLFLKASDSNIFEVGLSLVFHTTFNFTTKNALASVEIRDGFFVEWMEKSDYKHPLAVKFEAVDRTVVPEYDPSKTLDLDDL